MILAVSRIQNRLSPAQGYRGRFAPSPTGPLHAGSLVAALGSWLDARKHGGKWLVRIEDIDQPRSVQGADQRILAQLLACGLQWDEEPVWQSQRHKLYQEALEALNQHQAIYPCTCSRLAIANALLALGRAPARHQEIVYPGTCRPSIIPSYRLLSSDYSTSAWRLALPNDLQIEFNDQALGVQYQSLSRDVGDFILKRSDGFFTYQLAVVVDDAAQGITHIVRGQDLLSNTARQIYLQTQLGYSSPQYRHLPLVLDEYGEKLSKQTLASQINTENVNHALAALRQAAIHLGLQGLPDSPATTIGEWLLAATQAWPTQTITFS